LRGRTAVPGRRWYPGPADRTASCSRRWPHPRAGKRTENRGRRLTRARFCHPDAALAVQTCSTVPGMGVTGAQPSRARLSSSFLPQAGGCPHGLSSFEDAAREESEPPGHSRGARGSTLTMLRPALGSKRPGLAASGTLSHRVAWQSPWCSVVCRRETLSFRRATSYDQWFARGSSRSPHAVVSRRSGTVSCSLAGLRHCYDARKAACGGPQDRFVRIGRPPGGRGRGRRAPARTGRRMILGVLLGHLTWT